MFHIVAEPRPGVSFEALHRKIDFVLSMLRAHPPLPEQVDAGARRILRGRFLDLEDSLAKAQLLVDLIAAGVEGDPVAFEQRRFTSVTPAHVQAFVARYLTPERRVVVYATPAGQP